MVTNQGKRGGDTNSNISDRKWASQKSYVTDSVQSRERELFSQVSEEKVQNLAEVTDIWKQTNKQTNRKQTNN